MKHNSQRRQITVDCDDPSFVFIKEYIGVYGDCINFSYEKIPGLVEYLSQNNDGDIKTLFLVAELLLIYMSSQEQYMENSTELYELYGEVIRIGNDVSDMLELIADTEIKNKPLTFKVSQSPYETFSSVMKKINEIQSYTGSKSVYKSMPDDIPTVEFTPYVRQRKSAMQSRTLDANEAKRADQKQRMKEQSDKWQRRQAASMQYATLPLLHNNSIQGDDGSYSYKTKIQKYFTQKDLISKLLSATKAKEKKVDVEIALSQSSVINGEKADRVAVSAKRLYGMLANEDQLKNEKGAPDIAQMQAIKEQSYEIRDSKSILSKIPVLNRFNDKINRNDREQISRDYDDWMMRKTTVSRAVAQLDVET